jgi:phosphatidylinositol alpha-1,6-mannosyltransferase
MPNRTLGGSEWEGFGIAFIEAALFGKPSIGGNNGGVADAIVQGKTGFLVDTSDAAGTTQALQMLMMDKDMRIAMGRAARQRAEMDFDWKKLAISFAEAVS